MPRTKQSLKIVYDECERVWKLSCPGCHRKHELDIGSDGEFGGFKYSICWMIEDQEDWIAEVWDWEYRKDWQRTRKTEEEEGFFYDKPSRSLYEVQKYQNWDRTGTIGYRVGKQEYGQCGKCSQAFPGAGHHSTIKNRNKPEFWGLIPGESFEENYKALCGKCLEEYDYLMPPNRKKEFRRYRREGKL